MKTLITKIKEFAKDQGVTPFKLQIVWSPVGGVTSTNGGFAYNQQGNVINAILKADKPLATGMVMLQVQSVDFLIIAMLIACTEHEKENPGSAKEEIDGELGTIPSELNDQNHPVKKQREDGEAAKKRRFDPNEFVKPTYLDWRKCTVAEDVIRWFPKVATADDLIELWEMNKAMQSVDIEKLIKERSGKL